MRSEVSFEGRLAHGDSHRVTVDEVGGQEQALGVGDVTLRVRESGDPHGAPVIHFHGTPGSRLELAFADEVLGAAGIRLIAFDRPGYGGSTQIPFGLTSVAKLAVEVANRLGIDQFRTTGWSGGGPFAMATAAVAGGRVPTVGVIAGAGPFQLVPGAIDGLSEGDRAAEKLLPDDPQAACERFLDGFDMSPALEDATSLYRAFEPLLSASDRIVWDLHKERILVEMREAMSQGVWGCGWDNVAWIGPWDFDPQRLECPVLLWYGSEDRMAEPSHAHWLESHLPHARLTMYQGEGHLLPFAHLDEMLTELLAS